MHQRALLRALAALTITAAAATVAVPTAASATAAAPTAAASAGRFSATYVDPYAVWGASSARLDAMFAAQRRIGITTAIVQWTGYVYGDGSVSTTYPASPATRFGAFDTVLPRLLGSARKNGVKVWLGLAVRPSLFDDSATMASSTVFTHDAAVDQRLAADLLAKYRGQFVGWYLPSEPGYQSVRDASVQRAQTAFLRSVTSGLHRQRAVLPTMISPCVPRAIEGGLTGTQFVERLAPMIRGAGIDVWNLQDGFAMTAWTPAANLTMLRTGASIAASARASVWATVYTPGPGAPSSMTTAGLFADLDTIRAAGVPVTTWTFADAFDPAAARSGGSVRASNYRAYAAHIGARI
jgi:hypothetical protein